MSLLLKLFRQPNGLCNIPALRRLIATDKQQQKAGAAYRVVNAVARSRIDLEFRDAVAELSMLTRVAVKQTINSNLNPGAAGQIF